MQESGSLRCRCSVIVLLVILVCPLITLSRAFTVPLVENSALYMNEVATSSSPQSDLESAAELIVRGAISKVYCQLKKGTIWSRAEVTVQSVEKGMPVSKVIVEYEGGEVGDVGLIASNQPRFSVGEHVLLYLVRGEGDAFNVVGGPAGKVLLDSSGRILNEAGPGYSYSGIHWPLSKVPIGYYVNTAGGPAGALSAVEAGFQAWNEAGTTFSFRYLGEATRQDAFDGQNVVCWRYYDGPGRALAVAMTWYYLSTQEIVECDIRFDSSDSWATDGSDKMYDVQNVAAHESGHWLSLNDLYDLACCEMTMYGYAGLGETKKRTLELGDVAGIRAIYPSFDFGLSNSGGVMVTQGGSGSNRITVTFASAIRRTVTLSASVPSQIAFAVVISFNPSSGDLTFTSICTITASSSAPTGSYTITVVGTSGAFTRTTSFTLTVYTTS